jgi:hypothetical protein
MADIDLNNIDFDRRIVDYIDLVDSLRVEVGVWLLVVVVLETIESPLLLTKKMMMTMLFENRLDDVEPDEFDMDYMTAEKILN